MLTMQELLGSGVKLDQQSDEVQENLKLLLERINKVRTEWNHPMTVTSGLRTKADQLRIYKAKGIPENKIPWGSQHLKGAAVDIYDPKKELQTWCLANEPLLKSIGLWMEHFSATPNWCHFQVHPYGSYTEGKSIWFHP